MNYRRSVLSVIAVTGLLFSSVAFAQENAQTQAAETPDAQQQAMAKMAKEIHKQIFTLPQYSVFDNIYFGIKDNAVTLYGKVTRPTLKSSAENVTRKVEGVKQVDNKIEVLPVSPNDDRIRAAVYASIYRYAPLQRYSSGRGRVGPGPSVARMAGGITNDPPIGWHAIHIIVENGNVTLVGTVNTEGDLSLAGMRANIVPGVFSVTNDLQVAQRP